MRPSPENIPTAYAQGNRGKVLVKQFKPHGIRQGFRRTSIFKRFKIKRHDFHLHLMLGLTSSGTASGGKGLLGFSLKNKNIFITLQIFSVTGEQCVYARYPAQPEINTKTVVLGSIETNALICKISGKLLLLLKFFYVCCN